MGSILGAARQFSGEIAEGGAQFVRVADGEGAAEAGEDARDPGEVADRATEGNAIGLLVERGEFGRHAAARLFQGRMEEHVDIPAGRGGREGAQDIVERVEIGRVKVSPPSAARRTRSRRKRRKSSRRWQ